MSNIFEPDGHAAVSTVGRALDRARYGARLASAVAGVARRRLTDLTSRPVGGGDLGRGVALRGTVWPGGDEAEYRGTVLIGPDGTVAAIGPVDQIRVPDGVRLIGGAGFWVGPGVTDAHVHLAFGDAEEALRGGVVAVRDLGAPLTHARRWRTSSRGVRPGTPYVASSGPLLTSPGGYPSRTWGSRGFSAFVQGPDTARSVVRELAADGADLIKIALEPGPGWPVPRPEVVRAIVRAAHDAGLATVAHALTVETVARALEAGVDELAHTPQEPLTEQLVERIAAAGIVVTSTLQTFFSEGNGPGAARNAAALHRAGVPLVYGTDLGNAGTRSGVDPRELDRLAAAGLGRLGALRAATEGSARAAGVRGRTGRLVRGAPAAAVLLSDNPLVEPGAWCQPVAVVCDGWMVCP